MKDIIGYEGLYAVDETGNVWSYRKNAWLKPGTNKYGYYYVNLCKDKKARSYTVHRLLAQAFLENYSEDLQVDHINGCRINNNISNLRMVTCQKNQWNRKTAKGYYWNKKAEKWQAYIKADSKSKFLGYFNTEAEARDAYLEAKKIMHVI